MMDTLAILDIFFVPAALAIMLVYIFGFVSRAGPDAVVRCAMMGMTFGFAAALSMRHPIELGDGFLFDLRNLFVGVSIAFFGPIAGLLSLAIAAFTRLSLGGDGAMYGLLAMSISFTGGLIWRMLTQSRDRYHARSLFGLGGLVSLHLVVGLMLPTEMRNTFFTQLAVPILALNLLGSFMLGRLIQREETLIEETRNYATQAATDSLTDLVNRRHLETLVSRLPVPKNRHAGRAVVYLDIDHFKAINDTHGHLIGDAVLTAVVARIRSCLRPDDIFARLGGDEFSIVLPNCSEDTARVISQRCRDAVAGDHVYIDGQHISVTVSVGVYWSDNVVDFATQLVSADKELYAAKAGGRNQVSFRTVRDMHKPQPASALPS